MIPIPPDSPDPARIWVFGYGSLVWKPGFEFLDTKVGFVSGWSRRFWQGNDVHRGSPAQLGRVVTLIKKEGAVTFGRAFLIKDAESARMYLDHRESSLGGYTTVELQFSSLQVPAERMTVLAYIALPCNPLFLGAAPLETIALQIAHSHGHSGHNVEYLAKLSAFMTLHVPRQVHYDHHLMALETLVLEYVRSHKPDLLHHFQTALADVPVFERERFSALPPSLQVQEASRGETFLIAMRNQAKDHEPKRKQEDFVEEKTAGKSFTPSSPSKKHFSESFIKEQFSALLTESVYFN